MKKTIIYIVSIVIVICVLIASKLYTSKEYLIKIKEFNTKYENYTNNEIVGTEVASIINQAVDDNEYERIKKDKNGKYIQNDINSINIEVKITEFSEEQIYTMETLYNGGMDQFVKYYGQISFKAKEVKYNENKRIKYILFEQILN